LAAPTRCGPARSLGGIRTYAHLGEFEFTYDNWMEAVRHGNTSSPSALTP
jgi:hypothetical protein